MTVKIYEAIDNRDKKLWTIGELESFKDINSMKGYLVCPNCKCKLTFVHSSEGKTAYLRTWKGQDHSADCENFFKRKERERIVQNGTASQHVLTSEEMRQKHRHMWDKLKNESYDATLSKPSSKRKKTPDSGIVGENTKRNKGRKIVPTTNRSKTNEVSSEESRGKIRLKYPYIDEVSAQEMGTTFETGGTLIKVKIIHEDSRVVHGILTVSHNNKSRSVELYEDFFANENGQLGKRMSSLSSIVDGGARPIISLTVEARPASKDGRMEIVLRESAAMMLDKRTLAEYVGYMNA